MAGPKVIAIDAAYGSDLVARFEKWGIINQINVGDNASLIFEAGREHLPTGPFVFHFTKPDGTGYSTNPGLSYDTQLMFGYATYGRFSPSTYVIYIFAAGELDQAGEWSVTLSYGTFTSTEAKFTISP